MLFDSTLKDVENIESDENNSLNIADMKLLNDFSKQMISIELFRTNKYG